MEGEGGEQVNTPALDAYCAETHSSGGGSTHWYAHPEAREELERLKALANAAEAYLQAGADIARAAHAYKRIVIPEDAAESFAREGKA